MKLGEWTWHSLETGRFRLDGGAMFGNVPKVLWEKTYPADDANRIPMALRCLLLIKDKQVILIDTGLGHKWTEKQLKMYHVDYSQLTLQKSLESLDLTFSDVTDVVLTHLHFDHAGGATCFEGEKIVPTFPQATYHVQKDNLQTATEPNVRERASYLKENWEPLISCEQLKVYENQGDVCGLEVFMSYGHTQGMQVVTLREGDQSLSYCADLIPLRTHVTPVYTMGYDIHPLRLIDEKVDFLKNSVGSSGLVFFEHDPDVAAATLGQDKRGRPVVGETVLEAL